MGVRIKKESGKPLRSRAYPPGDMWRRGLQAFNQNRPQRVKTNFQREGRARFYYFSCLV